MRLLYLFHIRSNAWVKVFRITPELRILRLTFHRKSAGDNNRFSDLYSVCLKTIDHLNFKFSGHTASFKIGV